ncbi:hypothetical protein FRC07_006942 [Ceratobasidium sp. 392]|nr:hypothetical protein FRC07_006942 [Ceratobasidium sp. 392]
MKTSGSTTSRQIEWVPKLLAPSLLSFEMNSISHEDSAGEDLRYEHSWLTRADCLELVDIMSDICPRINTLRIFPTESGALGVIREDAISNKIARLKHLSALALGTVNASQELFNTLGQLPHLETLSLHSDALQPMPHESAKITISDDLFLALRHLELRGMHDSVIQRLCASPLFHRLVKASIIFLDHTHGEEPLDHHTRSKLIAQCFGANSSRIVDLTLLTVNAGNEGFSPVAPDILVTFEQMPLRRLRLGTFPMKYWLLEDLNPEIKWHEFLVTVPRLEELHLELHILKSSYLPLVASMLPNLRLLVLRHIEFDKMEESTGRAATQPITIQCSSYSESEREDLNLYDAASIWPNATCETEEQLSWEIGRLSPYEMKKVAELNKILKLL